MTATSPACSRGEPLRNVAQCVSDTSAASGASAPASGAFFYDTHGAISQRLIEAKNADISWHIVLNNHASKRPKAYGGPLCHSVKACKTFGRVGSMHSCRIVLPNSYAPDDGKVVDIEAVGPDKRKAEDYAGCAAFAILCSDKDGLPNVIFRPAHWKVPIATLVADIGRIVDSSATFQPLAVHQRPAASGAMVTGDLQNVPAANLMKAADLIRLCLRAHDGSFDPSNIEHKKIVQVGGPQEKVYAQLAALLPQGSLRQFVEQHPEFDIEEKDNRCYIKWQGSDPPLPTPGVAGASGACDAILPPPGGGSRTPEYKPKAPEPPAASGAASVSTRRRWGGRRPIIGDQSSVQSGSDGKPLPSFRASELE